MKWNHYAAKAETSHSAIAGVLLKAKEEMQQSIDFSELLEKLLIIVVRYINARQFINFLTFTASPFQAQASSLALKKHEVN